MMEIIIGSIVVLLIAILFVVVIYDFLNQINKRIDKVDDHLQSLENDSPSEPESEQKYEKSMDFEHYDKTFGVRMLAYLQDDYLAGEGSFSTPWGAEEFEYLCYKAYSFIKAAYADPNNKWYFDNMVPNSANCDDFANKWFKDDFTNFLFRCRIIKKKKNDNKCRNNNLEKKEE